MKSSTTYITPNKRLATVLRDQFDQAQTKQAWESLNILPYDAWLAQQWQQQLTHHTLLSDFEALLIWEKIIEESVDILLHSPAKLAKDAYERLQRWRLNLDDESFLSNEVQQFKYWMERYQAYCRKHQLIDKTQLLELIIDHINEPICLTGFNELTPEQKYLLERHPDASTEDLNYKKNKYCKAYTFDDQDSEINAMADWAIKQFKMDKKIACIIPELTTLRASLESQFKETFNDQFAHVNISAGIPLTDYPIILSALTLLSLHFTQPQPTLSFAITSPFLGCSDEEFIQRYKLDTYFREHAYIQKRTLLKLTEKFTPKFHELLTQFFSIDIKIKKTPKEWASYFSQALDTLGWPGSRVLNSLEYQTVMEFNRQLESFAKINSGNDTLSHSEALKLLKKLCTESIFQGQSLAHDVQVLGVLEAAGLEFDAIWITGLNDQAWPPRANPTPYLPIAMQRQYKMPHASAEKELNFTKQLTEQLQQSATETIFSYAHEQQQKLPSQLIPVQKFETYTLEIKKNESCEIEIKKDKCAPIYTENAIRGSTHTLKLQAECPFKAFAYQRLNAEALPTYEVGVSPIDRGILLHDTLHLIWKELGDQENLLRLDETSLSDLIRKHLDQAMKSIHLPSELKNLELRRNLDTIQSWLAFEKTRASFTVVDTEATRQYSFDNKQFKARLDRIDKLDNGDLCIIDYKTGKVTSANWYGERPTEPQLPFYAACEENTKAIAFADLRPGNQALKGTSYNQTHIKSIKQIDYWPDQIKQWQNECSNLLNDFCGGDAAVDPKTPTACMHCDLHGLCRVFETEVTDG